MSRFAQLLTVTVVLAAVVVGTAVGQDSDQATKSDSAAASNKVSDSDDAVQRGEYLVYHVAMCVQCHSPRNADGSLDPQRLLTGAPVPVKSPYAAQRWAFRAPPLKGLPGGWSEAQLVAFLQTGETPTGRAVRPPMPPFRMTVEDAQGVAAYLKSLDK